jgi:RHS repeat-associated protein
LTNYTYETALKRPATSVDSRTGTTTTAYVSATCDAVLSVTDAGSRVTGFTYDSRGNRLTTTLPDSTVAHTSYYPDGQVKATWGSQSYPTFLTYDYAGRRKELHTWRTAPTLTQSVNDPPDDSSVTTWNYSTTTGTLTSKLDDESNGATYAYTDAGRLETRTWDRGVTAGYGYVAGRLVSIDYSGSTPDVDFAYNRLGQTLTVTQDLQSKIEYVYDGDFALDAEIVSYDINHDGDFIDTADLIRTLDRSKDDLGRSTGWQLIQEATPNDVIENRVDYTYDSAGRLSTVADATNTFTYGYKYNQTTAADPRIGSTGGSKQDFMPYTLTKGGSPVLQTVRTYEARRDALSSISNTAGGTIRSSYTYSVNSIGQRTDLTTAFSLGGSHVSNGGDTDWGYDTLGQLQSANAPETESTADADRYFQYDDIGNRKLSRIDAASNTGGTLTEYFGVVTGGIPSQPGANVLNQYAAIKKAGTTREPVHDTDGNATAYPLPAHDSLSTLAWDAENRLTSVTVNGVDTTYLYDALSRRIAKTAGGTTTLFIYDGWNCIAEYTGTTLSEIRTWGLDLSGSTQGAGGVGGLLAEKQGGTYFFPTYDGNGNVSEYLAANGDTAAHFEYDPFGNTVVNTAGTGQFNYRFSTKPLDFETGLYYYGYRYYDPVTGRWPSRDPIGERGGVSLYAFVGNDGVSLWDTLGNAPGDVYATKYKAFVAAKAEVVVATNESVKRGLIEVENAKKNIVNKDGFYAKQGQDSVFIATQQTIEFKQKKHDVIIYEYVAGVEYAVIIYCIGKGENKGKFSYTETMRGFIATIEELKAHTYEGGVLVDETVYNKIIERGDIPLAIVHSHNTKRYIEDPVKGTKNLADQTDQHKLTDPEDYADFFGLINCSVTENGWDCTGGGP